MLNKPFWSNKIVKQQNQERYMNLQMDQLENPVTTHPIQTAWEISIERYRNWQFRCIDDPDCQFDNGLVSTRSRIGSDSSAPLLTLHTVH